MYVAWSLTLLTSTNSRKVFNGILKKTSNAKLHVKLLKSFSKSIQRVEMWTRWKFMLARIKKWPPERFIGDDCLELLQMSLKLQLFYFEFYWLFRDFLCSFFLNFQVSFIIYDSLWWIWLLTCVGVKWIKLAKCSRSGADKYFCCLKRRSSS